MDPPDELKHQRCFDELQGDASATTDRLNKETDLNRTLRVGENTIPGRNQRFREDQKAGRNSKSIGQSYHEIDRKEDAICHLPSISG